MYSVEIDEGVMMIKILACFVSYMVVVFCADICLEVGSVIPSEYIKANNCSKKENNDCKRQLYRTYANTYEPFVETEIESVRYVIGYNDETIRITFVHTGDLRFRTKAGLKVGSEIELTQDKIDKIPEWEIHGPADEDGWRPVIGYDEPEATLNGQVIIPGDVTKGFGQSDTIKVKILSFSKTR